MDLKSRLRKQFLANRNKFDKNEYFEKNKVIYNKVSRLLGVLCNQLKTEKNHNSNLNNIDKIDGNATGKYGLGVYFPLKTEPDLFEGDAFSNWCKCLPKVKNTEMKYVGYQIGDKLIKSQFGDLYEPLSNTIIVPMVVLVPGLAFDIKGYRLGYGVGHYDRYFAKESDSSIIKIGVCYDKMLLEKIHHDIHDIKMNYIITETNNYIL